MKYERERREMYESLTKPRTREAVVDDLCAAFGCQSEVSAMLYDRFVQGRTPITPEALEPVTLEQLGVTVEAPFEGWPGFVYVFCDCLNADQQPDGSWTTRHVNRFRDITVHAGFVLGYDFVLDHDNRTVIPVDGNTPRIGGRFGFEPQEVNAIEAARERLQVLRG